MLVATEEMAALLITAREVEAGVLRVHLERGKTVALQTQDKTVALVVVDRTVVLQLLVQTHLRQLEPLVVLPMMGQRVEQGLRP
jgi:hypothetical protein